MSAVEVLRPCALFKGFTDTGLQILAGIASERTYPAGVPLFVEGMLGDALIIVARGRVKLSTKNKAGEELSLGEIGPADYLGELTVINQGQRHCSATALQETTVVEIRYAEFQKLLLAKPQACLKLLMNIISIFGQKVSENREALKSVLTRP